MSTKELKRLRLPEGGVLLTYSVGAEAGDKRVSAGYVFFGETVQPAKKTVVLCDGQLIVRLNERDELLGMELLSPLNAEDVREYILWAHPDGIIDEQNHAPCIALSTLISAWAHAESDGSWSARPVEAVCG